MACCEAALCVLLVQVFEVQLELGPLLGLRTDRLFDELLLLLTGFDEVLEVVLLLGLQQRILLLSEFLEVVDVLLRPLWGPGLRLVAGVAVCSFDVRRRDLLLQALELLYGVDLFVVGLGQLVVLWVACMRLWVNLPGLVGVLRRVFDSEELRHPVVLRTCQLVRSEVDR